MKIKKQNYRKFKLHTKIRGGGNRKQISGWKSDFDLKEILSMKTKTNKPEASTSNVITAHSQIWFESIQLLGSRSNIRKTNIEVTSW